MVNIWDNCWWFKTRIGIVKKYLNKVKILLRVCDSKKVNFKFPIFIIIAIHLSNVVTYVTSLDRFHCNSQNRNLKYSGTASTKWPWYDVWCCITGKPYKTPFMPIISGMTPHLNNYVDGSVCPSWQIYRGIIIFWFIISTDLPGQTHSTHPRVSMTP